MEVVGSDVLGRAALGWEVLGWEVLARDVLGRDGVGEVVPVTGREENDGMACNSEEFSCRLVVFCRVGTSVVARGGEVVDVPDGNGSNKLIK